MEPMTLGSPGSPSAATGASNFLPSFLMGESNIPTTPRNNTLSPTKGRTLAFAQSPRGGTAGTNSPSDFNRSILQQKTLFGFQQQSTPASAHNYAGSTAAASSQQHNASLSGPPALGLFDELRSEKNRVPEPSNVFNQNQQLRSNVTVQNQSNNQSYQFTDSINDSYLNQSDFNVSRLTSPNICDYRASGGNLQQQFNESGLQFTSPYTSPHTVASYWITVFGFPQTATNTILTHFSQCGTIVDKVFPQQGGNWVHIKFASRLECDKAINYNERVIGNNLMIGVIYCKDPVIVDKENIERNSIPVNRVRPLTHMGYKSAQVPTEVILSPTTPKRSTGIVNKAMDMIFGW